MMLLKIARKRGAALPSGLFLKWVVLAVACCASFALAEVAEAEDRRPNILFMLTDDQRWDAIGLGGKQTFKNPKYGPSRSRGGIFQKRVLHHFALFAKSGEHLERAVRACSRGGG